MVVLDESSSFKFLLTRPSRGATFSVSPSISNLVISTHTPLAGRDLLSREIINGSMISTHTPLAGRDQFYRSADTFSHISTHTPLAGRDNRLLITSIRKVISTHTPLAGRDCATRGYALRFCHFYSHAPRGARPLVKFQIPLWAISTHTPLAGRDRNIRYYDFAVALYLVSGWKSGYENPAKFLSDQSNFV